MDRISVIFSVWILAVLPLTSVSGIPAALAPQCKRPLFNVIGKHYDKTEVCNVYYGRDAEIQLLREKYTSRLLGFYSQRDSKQVGELVEGLMNFVTPIDFDVEKNLMCTGCAAAVNTVRWMRESGSSNSKILDLIKDMCVDFNIMTPEICTGMTKSYGEVLLTVIEKSKEKATTICNFLLNLECGDAPSMWNVTFPSTPKPPVKKPENLPTNVKNLKVLHITDTHWDTKYQEGTWAECSLPLCCRPENRLPEQGGTKAGKYGGWKCDIPETTFDDMLRDIKTRHPDLDYVLWTGDIPPHDIWEQGKSDNLEVLQKTASKLRNAFPNTTIYPALGNHESVPPNIFPFSPEKNNESPMKWLYDQLGVEWKSWIPPNQINSVRRGAYYTTVVRPGLRIVSMNMNFCYSLNWWLVLDHVDPLSELQWLIGVLQEAEKKNERVHIIGHIPPGNSDCLKVWQTNYYKIIDRFENTVTAQFFGHTHSDKFELYYDVATKVRPVGVGYVAPSVTTYTYLNPAYRIYYIQGDSPKTQRSVVDHETWYLDLEEANAKKRAEWKKLYSAKKDFKMPNLSPEEWNKVYLRIAADNATLQLYDKFFWSNSPKRPQCDETCRKNYLCDIRSCAQYGPVKM